LAGCNLKLGNIEKALGLCTEVINRELDFIDAYSTRIQCYIKLKHNKHAIKDLNILINIHSAEKNIYLKLISELEQGIIESDELGSDVLEVDEIFRLNGIAIELRKSKRYPEAIDIYQILISQVHSELLYTELIQTNIEMKNYQNALGMCKKGFEIFGDAPHLLKTRAYLNIYINNFEQAKNDYKTLSAMFPLFGQQLKDENFIEYLEKMKMEYEMKKFEETMDFEED